MENANYIDMVGQVLAQGLAPAPDGPKVLQPQISVAEEVQQPDYILYNNNVGALSKDDLQAIKAKGKNGKSFLSSIFIASALYDDMEEDTNEWGFSSSLTDPRVVYFDTEQNRADTITLARRVHAMAGYSQTEDNPHFTAHSLRAFTPEERLTYIAANIAATRPDLVIVDGVADLLMNFNDIEESNRLIGELMKLSSLNHCAIVCVLHENKAKDDHGMKGHLGTLLLQKCSEVYQVKKVGDKFNVSVTDSRRLPLPDFSFMINSEGIPIPTESAQRDAEMEKALAKELKVRAILRDCFQYKPEQTYTELVANYQLHGAVGVATAKNSVAWAKEHGLLSVYLKAYKYVE